MRVHYQIPITYRCEQHCRYCFQGFDILPCLGPESDITEEEIRAGAEKVHAAGITVGKMRLTGGEPLLHPDVEHLLAVIKETWRPKGWTRVYSSGAIPWDDKVRSFRPSYKTVRRKAMCHVPIMVSPSDYGMKSTLGVNVQCEQQTGCGRAFDKWGFTFCMFAPAMARIFGFNVHSPEPIMMGREEVCRHCVCSIPTSEREGVLYEMHKRKEVACPSPSWAKAIKRIRRRGYFIPASTFMDLRNG